MPTQTTMSYPKPLQISGPMANPPQYIPENRFKPEIGGYAPYETILNRGMEKEPPARTGEKGDWRPVPAFAMPQPPNTVTISNELFEKMYYGSHNSGGGGEVKKAAYGNPTPLSIVGFLLSLSPLSCDLMGWRGAGGNGAASIGAYFFIGGVLMLVGGLMEWLMGNTFPFVVFASYGGFWFAYGATLMPAFNAFGTYSPDPSSPADGLATRGFNSSFGFFMTFMAVLSFVYLICSLRTNIVFVIIFAGLSAGFALLAITFFLVADANAVMAGKMLFMGGLVLFGVCMDGWYLLLALLLPSVDFPIALPVGDLSGWIQGLSEKKGDKMV